MSVIKNLIVWMVIRFSRWRSSNREECVLFSSHIPVQNLGDQALLLGAVEGLQKFSIIHIIKTGSDAPSKALEIAEFSDRKRVRFHNFDVVFASKRSFRELLALILFCGKFRQLYFIGADVLDGTYSAEETARFFEVVNILAGLNSRLVVVGSSFSKGMTDEAKVGLKNLDKNVNFYCRDELSLARVLPFFEARLSADAAFLMRPAERGTENLSQKASVTLYRIGVCLKAQDVGAGLQNFKVLLEELRKHCGSFEIIFAPHHPSDLEILKQAAIVCSESGIPYFLPSTLPSAPMIKALVKRCDLLVTGRMHVAIAGLAVGVFPVCVAYGDKFEGLYRHFEVDPSFFLLDRGFNNVESVMGEVFCELTDLRKLIAQNLPMVLSLSRANFE